MWLQTLQILADKEGYSSEVVQMLKYIWIFTCFFVKKIQILTYYLLAPNDVTIESLGIIYIYFWSCIVPVSEEYICRRCWMYEGKY